ncbi:hypothetical protein [Microvirga sp. BSC39]|uniref:hypothetical protein n=1 Tax=Microvirga sp. BSC39 TaxID=1549810 RepID=UPI00056D38E8|nr:hypothetical protein [Microvirga sp. BSC39]
MTEAYRISLAIPFVAISTTHAAATDASPCYAMSNSDVRNAFLAIARKDIGMCYAVSRPDLRGACLAEVRR